MKLQEATPENTQSVSTDTPARSGVDGILGRLSRWLERDRWPSSAETSALFTHRLTDVGANRTARAWSERYRQADDDGRRRLLAGLAAASALLDPREDAGLRLFRRLYAQSDNLHWLVELRADMLRWRNQVAGLTTLESELQSLLSNWFDVGMLELHRISWDSPASLLELLIKYEAVHEIRSWDDLRNRVADHRRCYAFFHPRMSRVPLIFVEVAFTDQMAADVQALLDPDQPVGDSHKARWAIFYSISNTQAGLRGISFGNFLLKRVIEELLREFPRLKSFATLSPMPGFNTWLSRHSADEMQEILADKAERQRNQEEQHDGEAWVARLQAAATSGDTPESLQRTALGLASRYVTTIRDNLPLDPVARFHLGNGARIERLNWQADTSAKGVRESSSIMVNYVYDLDQLDDNLAQLAAGKIRMARSLRWR